MPEKILDRIRHAVFHQLTKYGRRFERRGPARRLTLNMQIDTERRTLAVALDVKPGAA